MNTFRTHAGIALAYDDEGAGPPVLLLHGFAADTAINWRAPGVIDALLAAGKRVVGLDARGHGRSDKPHDPAAYADDAMVDDARALLDHLGIDEVDVAGYSMGALTTMRFVAVEPRVRRAILGGIGGAVLHRRSPARPAVADALEAEDPSTITDAGGRAFRAFADSTGADRHALAAIQRAPRHTKLDPSAIKIPTLVLTGDRDELAGSPQELADALPDGEATIVKGTHLGAVNDPAFTEAIVAFFK